MSGPWPCAWPTPSRTSRVAGAGVRRRLRRFHARGSTEISRGLRGRAVAPPGRGAAAASAVPSRKVSTRPWGTVIVVMDADLQHPPKVLPALVAPVLAGEASLVAGSRYVWAGGDAGLSGPCATWCPGRAGPWSIFSCPRAAPCKTLSAGCSPCTGRFWTVWPCGPRATRYCSRSPCGREPASVGNVGFDFAPRHAGSFEGDCAPGPGFFQAPRPPGCRQPAPQGGRAGRSGPLALALAVGVAAIFLACGPLRGPVQRRPTPVQARRQGQPRRHDHVFPPLLWPR